MDILALHERALGQTSQIIANIVPDQLELPTPCHEWNVRTLLNHLVAGNWRFVAAAEGKPVQRGSVTEDFLGDDPAGAYRKSAEALKRAWQDPALLDQVYQMPIGELPGPAAVSVRLVETVTHGWDLARATGQSPRFDDETVQAAMRFAQANLGHERPPGMPFASAVPIDDDLPPVDRLAAFMGRQPVTEIHQ
jgi:uncharacterized protein (TIGR03086 family)